MWEELENALAWFQSAPNRWISSTGQDLSAAAQWLWEVLQGDFSDDQTTAQVVTGTVISMIPLVDQICDVRDLVANCKKINDDTSNKWAWVALVFTLIGLFPTLGSLVKGCLKIVFGYARRGVLKQTGRFADSDLWQATRPWVEGGIQKLNQHLNDPAVRKTLSVLKIDNVYKYLADRVRELASALNVGALTARFDELIGVLKKLTDLIGKWGSAAMNSEIGWLLKAVKAVRDQADQQLGELVQPLQNWLNRLAQRLDVEHRLNYQAATNALNPHSFARPGNADELAKFQQQRPAWVDEVGRLPHKPSEAAPVKQGWPDISDEAPIPMRRVYQMFEHAPINPVTYPPGTVLYRIVDPKSNDNSVFWMSKAEFDKLRSKDDWRRRFAVWASWNSNGEFVTYTVPPGQGLKAWEGTTASQQMTNTNYVLEGGARQIALNPNDLNRTYLGPREFTGWGYDDLGRQTSLTGVPILQANWREGR
jgi:HAMP domain-containing protein